MINDLFYNKNQQFGPFVYRLGHVVFILERGVRFPRDRHKMSFYVYLILSNNNSRYTSYVGFTSDLKNRLKLHNSSKGAKFTRGRKWILIFKQKFLTKSKAMKAEYKLKKNYKFRKFLKQKYIEKNGKF